MRQVARVRVSLVLNVLLLSAVIGCILGFASDAPYLRFGPSEDLILVGVRIDTRARYATLLALIACMSSIRVVVAELGEPVLVFSVYNPDKGVVTDFTRLQLLAYANIMFFVSNVRRVFEVMVTVTQFDIAIFSVVVEQLASACVVYLLVREKRFDALALAA